MALFRKLFYRKPPDGLLEICERVYVFDCCFTTNTLEDQDYKGYVAGIVTQLRENYPDASILAFNFREGETQTQSEIGNALTEYDMTIMEYPRQYEGCPLLPMEVVHHFLRSSESWLSLGLQNLLLMHCERGGWPVLAFMLAALLIYRKHYSGEFKTLDMVHKQAPPELLYLLSPLNPIPSQLRYLQYVSRRNVATQWPPLDRALTMDCIIMRSIPNFDGKGGCRPIFHIYGQDPFSVSDRAPKVLFSTPKRSKTVRHYKQGECEIAKVDINCHIQGDVVLECISLHEDREHEAMMFRVMFNTAFIRSNILILNRDDIDVLWDANDLFPKDFRAEVLFSETDTTATMVRVDSSCFEEKDGLPEEAFAKVQEIFSSVDWLVPKGDSGVEIIQQSLAALEVQSLAKSPTNLSSEDQSYSSPKFSPNSVMARIQADQHLSPAEMRAIISSKLTTIHPGDHSPPSSTSPRHQFSMTKTLHLSPKQQSESEAWQRGMVEAKVVSPLSEPETSYAKISSSSSPSQSGKDADPFPGPSLFVPETFPLTPLEDKIGSESAVPTLTLLPPETSSGRPLSNDTICKPGISSPHTETPKSRDRVIEDGHPKSKSKSPLSPASSAEDLIEAPKVGNPPLPPAHSNLEKSTELGYSSLSRTQSPNLDAIQVNEGGSQSSKTDITLKNLPPRPDPSDLHEAPTDDDSASICGPIPPPPLSTSHFKEDLTPPSLIFTPHLTETTANASASSPPPPPPPPNESSSISGGSSTSAPPPPPPPPPALPPSISPLREDYAPEIVPPPLLSSPARDNLVSKPTPCQLPPPEKSSSGGEPTPHSGIGTSLSTPVLGDSSGTRTVPCPTPPPPPPPPQPPKEISGGGGPPSPPPPLHSVGSTKPPNVSPPQPPPPPPPPAPATPTKISSSFVPSAPPPPSLSSNDPASLSGGKASGLPGAPSPPPPWAPPPGTKGKSLLSRTLASRNNQMKKLKPLHWLKISRAVSGSLWAETQKSGEASKAPEIDISELESLFSAAVPNQDSGKKTGSLASISNKPEKVQLIDHRRAYNCEIMLSKVKIPLQDILSSVLALEESALDVDQVDNLIKFCPTKEEMEVLKGYKGEKDKLGKCEQFFLELMQVPRTEHKLRVYSFKIQFRSQVSDLRNSLNVVNSASDQIRGSANLKRIMQTILSLGNALNQGTARGSAVGFKLDSLLKLTDTRARNNKMTLMHYLCKVLSDKLPEVLDFWKDLSSLELASKIQLKFLAEEMQAINKGLEKVMQELSMAESDGPVSDQFCKALKEFLCFSEGEVRSLASLYATVGRNVDSLILYFGEDPARCPFEQVISTLVNFVRMFKQSHEENCKQLEFEKKKAEKEAAELTKINASEAAERTKMNASDTGHLLQSKVRSVN
ncbi:actin binding protein [Perilla frutescens var. frutescens]|nr:actin binding protein [Perilla frutescens var. frutescens]